MDNEQPTPTRKVIPPTSLVAIICLAVGLIIGYGYGSTRDRFEVVADGEMMAGFKVDKRTGEVWHFSPYGLGEKEYPLRWDKMDD